MKNKRTICFVICTLIVFISLACQLPGIVAPTPFVLPTADETITEIFKPTDLVPSPTSQPPTDTETPVEEPSITPQPTDTSPVPTATATDVSPTYTTMPTDTAVPTISYSGPGKRSGVSVAATYLDVTPNIDGVFGDWNTTRFTAESVVYGLDDWDNDNDLSSKFMLGWDEDYLYIAARVKDDVYVQSASGENLFKGDSIEILIDTDVSSDFYYSELNGDDYQLGMSPGNPQVGVSVEAYLWYPESSAGSLQSVKIGATTKDDGYRIEVKIPWNELGISPSEGQHFGFAYSVSDNDKSGEELQQSMVSNVSTRILTDPTTWWDFYLE